MLDLPSLVPLLTAVRSNHQDLLYYVPVPHGSG